MPPSAEVDKNSIEKNVTLDEDEVQLQALGYKQQLHREWHFVESFASTFGTLNFIGVVRSGLFIGLEAGGPAAVWSTFLISLVFMFMTAAVMAEICSALPLSGSIYIWAAESAGPKYARFFGFVVAWWTCATWMTYVASSCQGTAYYIASQLSVWEIPFPGGISNDNIKWRVFIWAISEGALFVSLAVNYLPPRWFSRVFRFTIFLFLLDFLLCMIWLPIGVSRTYGFRSAKEVFTQRYNATGAPAGWNWLLCFLFTGGTMIGFDAAGHIAEETKHANVIAARGLLTGTIASGLLGFASAILFLFCTPDLDTLFALDAPQPFVQIYALALGKPGSIVMTVIAVLGSILNTSIASLAASRLIFAVARDGVLPLSGWVGHIDKQRQPRNAVTVMLIFGVLMLCTIIPSEVAFYSLSSGGSNPSTASYGLIALLRLTMTPNEFKGSKFYLGKWRKLFYVCTVLFNGLMFAVQISPFIFPTNAQTFNFACVILGATTIFGIICWWIFPEEKWLRRDQVLQAMHGITEDSTSPVASEQLEELKTLPGIRHRDLDTKENDD